MPSGAPKGENCLVDMDSKAGDLFTASDAHPTGTGGAGLLAKYVLICFYVMCDLHQSYHVIVSCYSIFQYFVYITFFYVFALIGSGSPKASQPVWLKSGSTDVECPFDHGPALWTSASFQSLVILENCVKGLWKMWKLTTATTPSSFWASSSTACKASTRFGLFCPALSPLCAYKNLNNRVLQI